MHYIGIDIAKRFHYVGVRDQDGTPVGKAWRFDNNRGGFDGLAKRLRALGCAPGDDSVVAMEATGSYWMSLYSYLADAGWRVAVVNPALVAAFRKADTMRRTKTDAVDCFLVAEYARFKRVEPSERDPEDEEGLKQLTRYRSWLVRERTALKNKVGDLVGRLFPELPKVFGGDLFAATPLALLEAYGTPARIAKTDIRSLTKTVREASRGAHGRERAELVKAAARDSIGITLAADALAFELGSAVGTLRHLDGEISKVEREIAERLGRTSGRWLETIPGVGPTYAAVIAGEIGDPDRFESPKKLIAYAGIDPVVKDSGDNTGGSHHMSKTGSPQLRWALIEAADSVRKHDPYFGDYYDKMVGENRKHHTVALSGVARKLAGLCLALMREGRAYEPRPSVQSSKSPGPGSPQSGETASL